MFEHDFWRFSGIAIWVIILIYLLLRIFLGKNWQLKLGLTLFMGPGLKTAAKKMVNELEQGQVQKETLSEVVVHVFWRLTRLGMIGLLIAALPIWLLYQQNRLFEYQNTRIDAQTDLLRSQDSSFKQQNALITSQNRFIDRQTTLLDNQDQKLGTQNDLLSDQSDLFRQQNSLFIKQNDKIDLQNDRLNLQNNLIEADRRSSLVFLMSNILDKVDDEIKEQRDSLKNLPGYNPDSFRYELSKPLINRIVGLSRAFRPYRIMEGDTLLNDLVSPERGQLFIALMENNLDSLTQNTIVRSGDFSNAIVGKIDLAGAYLFEANLIGADLRDVDFRQANLLEADLRQANLRLANFRGAHLQGANLQGANISIANLSGANLSGTNLFQAYLSATNLSSTNLSSTNLSGAILRRAYLFDANLRRADLSNADFFEADLHGVDFHGADLRGADFSGADLSSVDLSNAMVQTKTWLNDIKGFGVKGYGEIVAKFYVDNTLGIDYQGEYYLIKEKKN